MLTNGTDEQKAAFDKSAKDMRDLKWEQITGYFDLDASGDGALRAGTVSEVTPTDKLREITKTMMNVVGAMQLPGFKQTVTIEATSTKIGGLPVDKLTLKQEVDEANDPAGIQKKMMTVLHGPEGMKQFMVFQPKRSLQTVGGDVSQLESLVKSLGMSPAKDSAAVNARKSYAAKANLIALVDVARLIGNGIKVAASEQIIPAGAGEVIDNLKLQPSFIGLSVACEPTAANVQFEVPAVQAQGVAKIVMTMMSLRMQ
jgi:hypothetical protein